MAAVPMGQLFAKCVEILNEGLRPMHYALLADTAALGLKNSLHDEVRVREDVREKLLCARRLGTAYVRAPYCLAVLQSWFEDPREVLLNGGEPLVIPPDCVAARSATLEALMRREYMITKSRHCDPERREMALANGMVVQHQVEAFIRARFPSIYREASNAGQWKEVAPDDFRIAAPGGRLLAVDVASLRQRDGLYGRTQGKLHADVHICARISEDERAVVIDGWVLRKGFVESLSREELIPPANLMVMLDCYVQGWDYQEVRRLVRHSRQAGAL